jgi:hypothetical protein
MKRLLLKGAMRGPALAALALAGCSDTKLTKCDDAIKATLKAPASYKRVSVSGSEGSYNITYDAVNSYNAPLRTSGRCFVSDYEASWYEDPSND